MTQINIKPLYSSSIISMTLQQDTLTPGTSWVWMGAGAPRQNVKAVIGTISAPVD